MALVNMLDARTEMHMQFMQSDSENSQHLILVFQANARKKLSIDLSVIRFQQNSNLQNNRLGEYLYEKKYPFSDQMNE